METLEAIDTQNTAGVYAASLALDATWEIISDKAKKYEETDEVVVFPPLHHFDPHPVWVGAFSRSIPSLRWRQLYRPAILTAGDIQATPPQIARAYLDWKFPKRLRARTAQLEFWKPRRSQPLLARPAFYAGEMIYLDMQSAYWQILQVIGWDVDYYPGQIGRQTGVLDFPYPANKIARNSMVTLGLPSSGFLWVNGDVIVTKHTWKVNIGLWSAVQDILNGIAAEMRDRAHAVYVNTDGYIIPATCEAIAYDIAEEWGIHLREKHRGRTTVYGVGSYAVGEKRTGRGSRLGHAYEHIATYEPEALKRFYRFLSDHPCR